MIILKLTINQGFNFSLDDTFFEKPQGDRVKLILLPPAV